MDPKHIRVATTIPPTTYRALRLAAATERRSGEKIIAEAIAAYCARYEPLSAPDAGAGEDGGAR